MTPPMTQDVEEAVGRLTADIEAEMKGVRRGYADRRGELLFRCLDALQRGEGPADGERASYEAALDLLRGTLTTFVDASHNVGRKHFREQAAEVLAKADAILGAKP